MAVTLSESQVREYAEKLLKGTISVEEKKQLEDWYNYQEASDVMWNPDEDAVRLREGIFDKITARIRDEKEDNESGSNRKYWLLAASIVGVFVIAGFFIYRTKNPEKSGSENAVVKSKVLEPVTYARSIVLPDGSTVVLHPRSNLYYPENFSGKSREVTLVGEAYFDIKHNNSPFIIHTGNINTVVLGTAFNIKAYPNQKAITVSVIRGKVRVEKKTKVLGVLTPDQQITCAIDESDDDYAETKKIDAAAVITDWTKQDMEFENISFQTVTELLSRRYGVSIRFSNPALAKCTIKAFFNGTEPLDKVLSSLCLISNSVFTKLDDNSIVLDGKGCEDL